MGINLGVLKASDLVVLNLPFSEDILDDSKYHHTVNVVLGTPQFVSNTLFLDGNTGLAITNSSALLFGFSDFTIEGFFKLNSISNIPYVFQRLVHDYFYISSNGSGQVYIRLETGAFALNIPPNTFNINTRYHFAFVRQGLNFSVYVNGNLVGSDVKVSLLQHANTTANLNLGAYFNGGNYTNRLNGYLDNFKITKKALYTANFTPPS